MTITNIKGIRHIRASQLPVGTIGSYQIDVQKPELGAVYVRGTEAGALIIDDVREGVHAGMAAAGGILHGDHSVVELIGAVAV